MCYDIFTFYFFVIVNSDMKEDTICAISTPLGSGGIAVVRLSGPAAIPIADQIFRAKNFLPSRFKPRELVLGELTTTDFIEKCMCVVFRKPNSFTGENLVEFQVHGGPKLAVNVLRECTSRGARIAAKGEFSKRAFLNGKASLDKLEGMIDMINAESDAELRAAEMLSSGKLSAETNKLAKGLVDILAEIEVGIDYPEEDIEETTLGKIRKITEEIELKIKKLLATSAAGRFIRHGVLALIVGRPNVGKSSLLNQLLEKERAIVTEIAGTTRDTVEDSFSVFGVKFNLVDTAGIHQTGDFIENIGIEKATKLVKAADLILFVVDESEELSADDKTILKLLENKNVIVVKNKTDKKKFTHEFGLPSVETNAKKGEGIEELKKVMFEKAQLASVDFSGVILTNERHVQALEKTQRALQSALLEIDKKNTLDIVAFFLKAAYDALGEITGTSSSEEIIDAIFAKFCVGK